MKKKKICQLCEATFDCSAEKCWCSDLPLVMTITKGEDCLCPNCLKKAIEKKLNK